MGAICPGQDTRYWRPDDIFEVDCVSCGRSVEFFKDDVRRRCSSCGTIVHNPKITLGCAQWCEHAKDCLGYDPKEISPEGTEEASLLERLIQAAKRLLKDDHVRLAHALAVTEEAEDLLQKEKANRKLVLASALLHDFADDTAQAVEAMSDAGMDRSSIQEVIELISSMNGDDRERRVLADAHRIAELRTAIQEGRFSLDTSTEVELCGTPAGRRKVSTLLRGIG